MGRKRLFKDNAAKMRDYRARVAHSRRSDKRDLEDHKRETFRLFAEWAIAHLELRKRGVDLDEVLRSGWKNLLIRAQVAATFGEDVYNEFSYLLEDKSKVE
jgi:hypothetical protein